MASTLIFIFSTILLLIICNTTSADQTNFIRCLQSRSSSNPISDVTFTPSKNYSLFTSVLQVYIRNKRFTTQATPKPLAIITAKEISHISNTIVCAKQSGLQLRIRSGGHDFEGRSYVSDVPFVILDMFNLRDIDIDLKTETAWVQAGATLGELYYRIAQKSKVHAFPAGVCPGLGIGGHITGGGYGNLMRKYGLSSDNVIDALLVDADGKVHNRESMGEDTFWAIRGGGAASFGVILSWKIKLVKVPESVTVFKVERTLEQSATDIVYQWQQIAYDIDRDLFIRAMPQVISGKKHGKKTIRVTFIALYLGKPENLLSLVNNRFPKLVLQTKDCIETSWVGSVLFWWGYARGTHVDVLLKRSKTSPNFQKIKSDYVKQIISKSDLEFIWKEMMKAEKTSMQFNPYGGKMGEILASETPFPHRNGNLFMIGSFTKWDEEGEDVANTNINTMRQFYAKMARFVSRNPRETFLNYKDLDNGRNEPSNQTYYANALSTYGTKYFKENFKRLVVAKNKFDPFNFFRHEQSITTNHASY